MPDSKKILTKVHTFCIFELYIHNISFPCLEIGRELITFKNTSFKMTVCKFYELKKQTEIQITKTIMANMTHRLYQKHIHVQ